MIKNSVISTEFFIIQGSLLLSIFIHLCDGVCADCVGFCFEADSTSTIPIRKELNVTMQIKYGAVLLTLTCVIVVCTLVMDYYPLFSNL